MSERRAGKVVWTHEVVSLARFQELEHSRHGRPVKIGDRMVRLETVEARGFTFVPVSGYQVLAYIFGEEVPPRKASGRG